MAINNQVRNQQLDILLADLKLLMESQTSSKKFLSQISPVNYSKLLLVENFLTSVMMNKRDVFSNGNLTDLGKKFEKLKFFPNTLSLQDTVLGGGTRRYPFSVYVKLFFDCLNREFDSLANDNPAYFIRSSTSPVFNSAYNRAPVFSLEEGLSGNQKQALNNAINKFRFETKSAATRSIINGMRQKATKRFNAAVEHFDGLLKAHGNLVCISLDLTFIKPLEEAEREDTFSSINRVSKRISMMHKKEEYNGLVSANPSDAKLAQDYFSKLIRNGKNHQALRDMVGYYQKWEFSFIRGFYSRTIFIFPQDSVKNIDTLIESISNYWNDNITDGKGLVEKAKLSKTPKQLYVTACTIKAHDKDLIENFKQHVLLYLTHIDQYYNPEQLKAFKNLFSRSEKKKYKEEGENSPRYS